MVQPQIQYCTTSDAVTIAFSVMGEGPPLLYLPPIWQHAQLDWEIPPIRGFYEWLASRYRLIRVDRRNFGLSQRGVEDVSLDAGTRDVAAVADKLELDSLSLFGHGLGGNIAIAYAACNEGRIHRLVVCNATAALRGVTQTAAARAFGLLIDHDWETFTETVAGMVWGWTSGEETRRFAQLLRESATHEDVKRWARGRYDVTDLLQRVSAPTLILHQRDAILTTVEAGRRLAARIANARFVSLEGRSLISYADPHMLAAIEAFFEEDRVPATAAPLGAQRTVTVLFTDLVGHTEMMRRLGDVRGRDVLRDHERITRDAIAEHRGTVIKTDGDSFMVSFGSVAQAMQCAVELQRAFAARNETAAEPLHVRMGLNAGEPIEDKGDLFGETVILASRIAAQAGAGEILIPEPVRHLLAGKGFLFADRGQFVAKGFEDAVRLYEVRWRDEG